MSIEGIELFRRACQACQKWGGAIIPLLVGLALNASGATFIVNSDGDESDIFNGDSVAEILPGSDITTFRAAIEEANALPGPDTILIDSIEMRILTALPPLSDPTGGTTIMGTSHTHPVLNRNQVGMGSTTILDGKSLDTSHPDYADVSGIRIVSANNVIQNVAFLNFPKDAVQIVGENATGNIVRSNFIGSLAIQLGGGGSQREPYYRSVSAPNKRHGIYIADGASYNVIGGSQPQDRNIVADNLGDGIHITGVGTVGNVVIGNLLGATLEAYAICELLTNPISRQECFSLRSGINCRKYPFPNKLSSLRIVNGANGNVIGGPAPGEQNYFQGRHLIAPCPEKTGAEPVVKQITSTQELGIVIQGEGTDGNRVMGNVLGLHPEWSDEIPGDYYSINIFPGNFASGHTNHAIVIEGGASTNIIGGEGEGRRNRVEFTREPSIVIRGEGTTGNIVSNNTINGDMGGVSIYDGASENLLGNGSGWGNAIKSNQYGVDIYGEGTVDNRVVGNEIHSNKFSGLTIHGGASRTIVGGTEPGEGNLIYRNYSDGVIIYDPETMDNQVLGNEIWENGEIGVFLVNGTKNNIIGGPEAGAGNLIHENVVTGVEIHDAGTTNNRIQGNEIYNNGTRGVLILDGASGNYIGGEPLLERNKIYDNHLAGIEINGVNTFENQIRLNSIYNNLEKGISLLFGANRGIQPPAIETFIPVAGSAPADSFVDIYADDAEEGEVHIGSTTTDSEGRYSVLLDLTPHVYRKITTTATDSAGNTSEFSPPLDIIPPAFLQVPDDIVVVEGDTRDLALTLEGSPTIALQWEFSPTESEFNPLSDGDDYSGVTTSTLRLNDAQSDFEGYYRCVADNGLGAVRSRAIHVRVVPAGLRLLAVNTSNDVSDGNTASVARLLAEPGADGRVSLREAIEATNAMSGENTIEFSVDTPLLPTAPLPPISDLSGMLRLDGGGTAVLDGSLLSGGDTGLRVNSGDNVIVGMSFINFPSSGLILSGSNASGNLIMDCAFGTDGESLGPNGTYGLFIEEGAHDNIIGGTGPTDGNLFAGNTHSGIALSGVGTSGNRIEGNRIGSLSPDDVGTGNGFAGVYLLDGASSNVVGGDSTATGNDIIGNTGIGVWVAGSATVRNSILNNTIFGNGELGIRLFEGGNASIARPVLTAIDPITGTAPPNSRVDCYIDQDDEGEHFLVTLQADGSGAFGVAMDLTEFDGMYVTAIATDSVGNTSAFSEKAAIDFSPPIITLNGDADLTVLCGDTFSDPGVLALDNIDGNITPNVVRTLLDSGGNPLENLDGASPGVYTLHYDVNDSAGYSAERVSRLVRVDDSGVPVVTLLGEDTLTLGCGEEFVDPGATAMDGCDSNVVVTVTGTVDTGEPGTYTLRYDARDVDGNVAETVERTVTVADTVAPEIARMGPAEMTIECGVPFVDPGATALDGCEGERPVTVTGSVKVNTPGSYALSYQAMDSSGNLSLALERVVTVVDTTAPVLTLNGPAEITLACGAGYAEAGATLLDSCDPSANVVVTGSPKLDTVGRYVITYDAVDSSGNVAATLTRTVLVTGDGPPRILLNGEATISLTCESAYVDGGARAVDACLGDISGALVVDNPVLVGVPGSYLVTYNVTDGAGTAATEVTRTVTIRACDRPCDALCVGEGDNEIDADGDGLSRCKEECVGSSDLNPDSDGDGMSDGYEYKHQLDPLTPDGHLDPDLDGLVNFEEFLENSSPRNSGSPVPTFFVSMTGVDQASGGTRTAPWATLSYALSRVSASSGMPVHIYLDSGIYVGGGTIKSWVTVSSLQDAVVGVVGTLVAEANSRLVGIDLSSEGGNTGLLFLDGENVLVRDCFFDGGDGIALTGVVVEGDRSPACRIEGCTFSGLDVGVDVVGRLPALRRSLFSNMAAAGVVIRSGALIGSDDGLMGFGLNGWNDFSAVAPGLAIINELDTDVSARWNDWGTTSQGAITAVVDGPLDVRNALSPGSADSGSGVELVVWTAASQSRVSGASVRLESSQVALNGTTDSKGRLSYPALASGTYELRVTDSRHQDKTMTIVLAAGMSRVVNVALTPNGATGPGEGPDGDGVPLTCHRGQTGSVDWQGDLVLLLLLFAVLASASLRRLGTD